MKIQRLQFGIFMAVCAAVTTLAAEPVIRDCKVKFYDIEGDDGNELLAALKTRNGIKGGYFAYTKYSYKRDCKALTTKCSVRIPRWQGYAASENKELKEKWQKFYEKLIEHEQGHVDRFRAAMRSASEKATAVTCKKADGVFKAAFNQLGVDQKGYDAETQHGVKKGASFGGSNYLSLAYSQSGNAVGYSYDQESEASTKARSLQECKANDCKLLTWANGTDKCISLAVTPKNAYGYIWARGRKEAEAKALAACTKRGQGCKIRTTICAGEGEVSP